MLRDRIHDLPNENTIAMVEGMVGFWKSVKVLDRKALPVGWGATALEHPLPWLLDLVAPVRQEIEGVLGGIEAFEW